MTAIADQRPRRKHQFLLRLHNSTKVLPVTVDQLAEFLLAAIGTVQQFGGMITVTAETDHLVAEVFDPEAMS